MYSAMNRVDREKVRKSFHRHASEYERHAVVQKRVVARMLDLLDAVAPPNRVLDVGCGTGMLLSSLCRRYPAASFTGVDLAPSMVEETKRNLAEYPAVTVQHADAEHLPLGPETVDLVTSTSTFQWLPNLRPAFLEARRVLVSGGTFRFALFGENTLHELRSSYRKALEVSGSTGDRTHRFHTADDVLRELREAGFRECSVSVEFEVETYPDVPDLLKAVRNVGAGNASPDGGRGLGERRVMLRMMDIYRREFGRPDGVPATYEVIYAMGKK